MCVLGGCSQLEQLVSSVCVFVPFFTHETFLFGEGARFRSFLLSFLGRAIFQSVLYVHVCTTLSSPSVCRALPLARSLFRSLSVEVSNERQQ